jgi:hypothetical protein
MKALLDYEGLVGFLEQNRFPHAANPALRTVEIPSKAAPLSGNLLVKWEPNLPLLQLVQFMIDDVPEGRIADLETALVRLNCVLELPGFGFDHARRRLFCRLTIPVFPPEGITPGAFHRLAQTCVNHAKEMYPSFLAVVEGAPGDQIARLVQENAVRAAAAQSGNLA